MEVSAFLSSYEFSFSASDDEANRSRGEGLVSASNANTHLLETADDQWVHPSDHSSIDAN